MFSTTLPLRWSDMDAQGHVNNGVIVDYLQEARVRFLRGGVASSLLDSGVIVVSHQVEYRRSIDYDDEGIRVELGVAALGAAKIEIAYELSQGGQVAVTARTVLCPFNFDEQRPVRLTAEQRAFFDAHRTDADPLRELEAPSLDGRGTAIDTFVRWSDLDSYGHVNNAMVFDYVQQARVTATTQWDPSMARAGSKGSQYMWLVARQDVDYVAQIDHRVTPFVIRVAPVSLGTSSIVLASEITDPVNGAVLVRARTILVCADLNMKKVELPARMRERLEPHLVVSDEPAQ